MPELPAAIAKRRTFAIIAHPDAGKTTLTEKLLLFGGAIQLAGAVKARGDRRRARSDWMKVERERGISVTTSVMTFDYGDCTFNLLDTPGHEDFSEDTYRTLTAVDSRGHGDRRREGHRDPDAQAVRGLPAARRADRRPSSTRWTARAAIRSSCSTRSRTTSQLDVTPASWPIGMGREFRGCYDLFARSADPDGAHAAASTCRRAISGRRA